VTGRGFNPGDRVYVIDSGLERLRQIMRDATGEEPPPNHHGTVDQDWGDSILINFDDDDRGAGQGAAAPYPRAQVRHLDEGGQS
jgi:hypothetical protein